MRTVRYKKGYSTAAAHMPQRALLCCCLAEGLAGAALAECVRPTLGGSGGTSGGGGGGGGGSGGSGGMGGGMSGGSGGNATQAAGFVRLSARACLCSRFAYAPNTTVKSRRYVAKHRCAAL